MFIVGIQENDGLLCINPYSVTLLSLLIGTRNFIVSSSDFLHKWSHHLKTNTVLCLFPPNLYIFFCLSFFVLVIFNPVQCWKQVVRGDILALFLILTRNCKFLTIKFNVSYRNFLILFIKLRNFPSIPDLPWVVIMHGCWILLKWFTAFFDNIVWFFC